MKFIVDMNMSAKWVQVLIDAGYAAQHWSSVGDVAALDTEIADFARAQAAIVLTRDLDFSAILAITHMAKPSVVHLRDKDGFDSATVSRVVMTLKAFETQLQTGAILSIAGHRARIRLLPLPDTSP